MINVVLGATLIVWSAGKFRELLDQAEDDCARVESYRARERAENRKRRHGRPR